MAPPPRLLTICPAPSSISAAASSAIAAPALTDDISPDDISQGLGGDADILSLRVCVKSVSLSHMLLQEQCPPRDPRRSSCMHNHCRLKLTFSIVVSSEHQACPISVFTPCTQEIHRPRHPAHATGSFPSFYTLLDTFLWRCVLTRPQNQSIFYVYAVVSPPLRGEIKSLSEPERKHSCEVRAVLCALPSPDCSQV